MEPDYVGIPIETEFNWRDQSDPKNWRHIWKGREIAVFHFRGTDTMDSRAYFDQENTSGDWMCSRHDKPYDSAQYGLTMSIAPCCGANVSDFDMDGKIAKHGLEKLHQMSILDNTTYDIYRHQFLTKKLRGCRFLKYTDPLPICQQCLEEDEYEGE